MDYLAWSMYMYIYGVFGYILELGGIDRLDRRMHMSSLLRVSAMHTYLMGWQTMYKQTLPHRAPITATRKRGA